MPQFLPCGDRVGTRLKPYNLTAISVRLLGFHPDIQRKDAKAMFEINPVKNRIQDLTERSDVLRGYL